MIRWQLTELTPSGYGRRLYAGRRQDAEAVADSLGGRWRLRRQAMWRRGWRLDGGRDAERIIGTEHPTRTAVVTALADAMRAARFWPVERGQSPWQVQAEAQLASLEEGGFTVRRTAPVPPR